MTRSRRKGSRRMKRHYSLRGGGLISDIWGAGQFVTDSWWGSYVLGLPGMSRAAMSLLHDTNIAFEFYTYCNNIDVQQFRVGAVEGGVSEPKKISLTPDKIDRFNDGILKLKQFLTTIINSAVLPKMFGYGYAKATGNKNLYEKILTEFSTINERINGEKLSTLGGVANEGMITMWGDWYRYELNIHVTNLSTMVQEMIGMSVLPMKPFGGVDSLSSTKQISEAQLVSSAAVDSINPSMPPHAANSMFASTADSSYLPPSIQNVKDEEDEEDVKKEAAAYDWWVSNKFKTH